MEGINMKIMLVNSVYGVGSTGRIVKDLKDQINASGNYAMVCFGRGTKVNDKEVKKICSNASFYTHAGISRVTGLNGMFSNAATKKLIDEIENFKPDVIHLHNLHGYYLNYYKLIEFLKNKGIPIVWTLHDELMFTGNCSYAFTCDKWKSECKACTQIKDYPKSMFFDTSKLLYHKKKKLFAGFSNCHIVTPSNWLAERVKQSIIYTGKIKVIHNGIDVHDVFVPGYDNKLYERINPQHKKIILTVTDDIFCERKGIKYFIELASKFKDYLFVVLGGVFPGFKSENIMFIDRVNSQRMLAEYYSMADAFVITSMCDNFPTVCIEALACGTPVIGFATGGTMETAPDLKIGMFSKYAELDALASNLRKIVSSDREKLRSDCRNYAVKHYSKEEMTNSYLDLYREQ